VSRDTSQIAGDRRLWLAQRCPRCGASPGARCRPRATGRVANTEPVLHVARGWRQRRCPTCKARPGEPCRGPSGRAASRPHAARLGPARRELAVTDAIWRALERIGASVALVRFAAGRGLPASVEVVALAGNGGELGRWQAGESELSDALAAPVWARYGSFRGQPPITATLRWSVAERSLSLAGSRGGEPFAQTLAGTPPASARATGDTSPQTASRTAGRVCERCGKPIAQTARAEARYCGKLCRQAASRARLRERSGRSSLALPERCAWCKEPMPEGRRLEARYCSKRCRQAASRARLAPARRPAASAQAVPSEQLRIE
jgi:hypothetical protein